MMKDVFANKIGMHNSYLIEPFTVRIQFAFRNSYNLNFDDYKYWVALVNEKVRINIDPITLGDIMRF